MKTGIETSYIEIVISRLPQLYQSGARESVTLYGFDRKGRKGDGFIFETFGGVFIHVGDLRSDTMKSERR